MTNESGTWKAMVLRSGTTPSWLGADAPYGDVVLSSRVRVMRNLAGKKFPHKMTHRELNEVMDSIIAAAAPLPLELQKALTGEERDYLVGSRLVSPDFAWKQPGRAVLIDASRAISIMINEEDHLRIQALTAGWSIPTALGMVDHVASVLGEYLEFAHFDPWGYLSASPYNCGEGKRLSSMLHLIGLAISKRLPNVLKALNLKSIVARGLYGESSRAIGAYLQISITSGSQPEFDGAMKYLIQEEKNARRDLASELNHKVTQAHESILASVSLPLDETLRLVGWLRYAACAHVPWAPATPRVVDRFLATLDLGAEDGAKSKSALRAKELRAILPG